MGMLVLTRKAGEVIDVENGRIRITTLSIRGNKVRIGIEAPDDVKILRTEIMGEEEGEEETPKS